MRYARHTLITLLLVVPVLAVAQDAGQPTNDAPNNYNTIKDYFKLPEGRTWGSTSAVDIDKDGTLDLGRRALRSARPAATLPRSRRPARCRICRRC